MRLTRIPRSLTLASFLFAVLGNSYRTGRQEGRNEGFYNAGTRQPVSTLVGLSLSLICHLYVEIISENKQHMRVEKTLFFLIVRNMYSNPHLRVRE